MYSITIDILWPAFQYSLTNLVWCNIVRSYGRLLQYEVSVFSDESRVVQLEARPEFLVFLPVSVFSDESRVVQLLAKRCGNSRRSYVSVFSDESRVVQPEASRPADEEQCRFSIL